MDKRHFRRRIAGASLFCLSAGLLTIGGCAGGGRDSIAGGVPGKARLTTSQVAASQAPGRATLSDAGRASRSSGTSGQVSGRTSTRPSGGAAAEPTIAKQETGGRSLVQEPPARSSRVVAPASRQSDDRVAAPAPRAEVAARRGTQRPQPSTPASKRPADVERTAVATRKPVGVIRQASASRTPEARRSPPPVIRPATPETAAPVATTRSTGFERQRADLLMERAQDRLQHNFREEALRLALVAQELELSQQAQYLPGEARPSDFVARLRAAQPGDRSVASADDQELEALLRETRSGPRGGSRVELTGVAAGWQSSSSTIKPSAKPRTRSSSSTASSEVSGRNGDQHSAGATGTANRGRAATGERSAALDEKQVALVSSSNAPSSSAIEGASPDNAGSTSAMEAAPLPAPQAEGPAKPTISSKLDEFAEDEPLSETRDQTGFAMNLTTASVTGLIAGIAGLLGLSYWRRHEIKRYAKAGS